MPQYELAAVDDKGEDANPKDDRGATAARNARIKRVAIIVGAVLLGLLILILIIWGISALMGYQLLSWEPETFVESIPGANYRTNSSEDGSGDLIWIHTTPVNAYRRWVDTIDKALQPYMFASKNAKRNVVVCDYDHKPPAGMVCDVDVKRWAPCVRENYYNYHRNAPCIFLKFKEIPDWNPEFYNSSSQLPENMPEDLKQHIKDMFRRNSLQRNTVWVSCEGETPTDVENFGPVHYIPTRGFPGYYFPYEGQDGYLSPIVALLLERPRYSIVISVICKLWAPNIQHEGADRLGQMRFELLID